MRPRFRVEVLFLCYDEKCVFWEYFLLVTYFPVALFWKNNPKYVMQKFAEKGMPTCIIWDNGLTSRILKILFCKINKLN